MSVKVLWEGLIYACVLSAIVTISQFFNPRLWLNDYPKEIQNMVPENTKEEKLIKGLIGIPFLIIMFAYPIYSTYALKISMGTSFTILIAFFNMLIISSIFNLFDLLILDWLIFCRINPKYLILKGTNGARAYQDYNFHLRAARKGFRISVLVSAVVSILISL